MCSLCSNILVEELSSDNNNFYHNFVIVIITFVWLLIKSLFNKMANRKHSQFKTMRKKFDSEKLQLQRQFSTRFQHEFCETPGSPCKLQKHSCNWHNWQLQRQQSSLAKREAMPHSAPYVVSIQLMTEDNEMVHYCAGTILNENWILTAAHCLTNPQMVDNSIIVAGCHDLHDMQDASEMTQLRHIDFYVKHDLYLGGVNPYDVALIYIKDPLKFDKFVQAANLPKQDAIPQDMATLYGWGNVSMTAVPKYPHRLQLAEMPILDWNLSEQILAKNDMELHETNLCTGPLTGGIGICDADSGGPLMQELDAGVHEIIGIVSWGKMPCGQRNSPSVFVRVSAFTTWIQQIMATVKDFSQDLE